MKSKKRCRFHVQLGTPQIQWERLTMHLRYRKDEPLAKSGQTVLAFGMAGKYEVKIERILATQQQDQHIVLKARVARRLTEPRILQG